VIQCTRASALLASASHARGRGERLSVRANSLAARSWLSLFCIVPSGRASGSFSLALRSQRNVSIDSVLSPHTACSTSSSTSSTTSFSADSSSPGSHHSGSTLRASISRGLDISRNWCRERFLDHGRGKRMLRKSQ
jgi:hypothetical protein